MDWPAVTVMLITYDRPDEIRRTIYGLLQNLRYPRDKLLWHIADDSSPGNYIHEIQEDFRYLRFTNTVTNRKGWGANVNKALTFCYGKSSLVYLNEDDYVATREINLEKAVALITSKNDSHKPEGAPPREEIGMVRFGFGAHWMTMQQREADTEIGRFDYLHLLKSSPFLNVYSHRPALRHRRLTDVYGLYKEGIPLADSETEYAGRIKRREDGPWITCLSDCIDNMYNHIGKSRQGSEHDRPQ
jgi:hypothetical protein